jgi:hypothetical protein
VYPRDRSHCPHCGTPEEFSDPEFNEMRDYVYDIETYPNIFTCAVKHVATGQRWLFEISDRRNDYSGFYQFVQQLRQINARMVGFNSEAFDYPVVHYILTTMLPTARGIYEKAISIINNQDEDGAFSSRIYDNDKIVAQLDLFKIHHFDNRARATSLKVLQFNMDSDSVEDLPFPVGTVLTSEQMDDLIRYNWHDVDSTEEFYLKSLDLIEFREQLSLKYGRNFLNHNDTKIGKDYFVMRLEQVNPEACYTRDPVTNRRTMRQTLRPEINLAEAVFPYVRFESPEFTRVLNYFKSQRITETKGVFKDLTATVNGFTYVFGAGGIHGSIDSAIVESDDQSEIIDVDVTSYYPRLAIENRVFPAHLGEVFCDIYREVYEERAKHAKGTAENAMLKLALNGVYGDSNNKYSPFFDPLYTMKITINGQLLLCLLAENVAKVPGLQIIQVNTDGLTAKVPRAHTALFREICEWWQRFTCLDLEFASYSRMFIRDVNNYIAEGTNGKIKRKGAYEYFGVADGQTSGLQWHQNHSGRVIARAAEAALLDGENIADFVRSHPVPRDFYMLAKVPRSSRLVLKADDGTEVQQQNTTRYFVSNTGGALVKIMPPLPGKTANGDRRIGIDVGFKVTIANRHAPMVGINYGYYVAEAEKLVAPLRKPKQGGLF